MNNINPPLEGCVNIYVNALKGNVNGELNVLFFYCKPIVTIMYLLWRTRYLYLEHDKVNPR